MNGIKILAHADGYGFCFDRKASATVLQGAIICTFGSSSSTAGTSIGVADRSALMTVMAGQNGDSRRLPDMKPNHTDELEKSNTWMLTDFNKPSQLRSLRLPDCLMPVRISRLTYTNSGGAILALGFNAVHKLWKWQANEGKATSSVPPQLWQPSNGVLMTNDMNPEDAIPCFALSKNDSYLISASGGKSSLYNMMTFERMTTFMPPPPAATFVAFYPQDNNIVAIGIDDSSIDIYNVRFDEIKSKLKGHQKRVTGLAFSNVLNILVSSGADAQLCVWSMDEWEIPWEKQASKFLQIPPGRVSSPCAQTRVQFHQDQIHVLAVHETQIAIYKAPKLDYLKQVCEALHNCPFKFSTLPAVREWTPSSFPVVLKSVGERANEAVPQCHLFVLTKTYKSLFG